MQNDECRMQNRGDAAANDDAALFYSAFCILHSVFTTMSLIALEHYLAVGAIMFVIGLIGFMSRRNLIVIFLCTELMLQGVAINLIAFSRYHRNLAGQAFVIFVLVIAAAEASLALGLVVLLFRQKQTLDADAWRELRG
jgi:NADH-quinone oxidoreductase subunit K